MAERGLIYPVLPGNCPDAGYKLVSKNGFVEAPLTGENLEWAKDESITDADKQQIIANKNDIADLKEDVANIETEIADKSEVSGENDGTNWTSLTIDGTTKAIPSGGGGGGFTPTQAQLDAMNSGIDSTKVAQIETNADDITNKVDKETGKGLSTNDFTTAEKEKLNDLVEVSGTNDGTNWTKITIDGVEKDIPAGGGGSSYSAGNGINISNDTISAKTTNTNVGIGPNESIGALPQTFRIARCEAVNVLFLYYSGQAYSFNADTNDEFILKLKRFYMLMTGNGINCYCKFTKNSTDYVARIISYNKATDTFTIEGEGFNTSLGVTIADLMGWTSTTVGCAYRDISSYFNGSGPENSKICELSNIENSTDIVRRSSSNYQLSLYKNGNPIKASNGSAVSVDIIVSGVTLETGVTTNWSTNKVRLSVIKTTNRELTLNQLFSFNTRIEDDKLVTLGVNGTIKLNGTTISQADMNYVWDATNKQLKVYQKGDPDDTLLLTITFSLFDVRQYWEFN